MTPAALTPLLRCPACGDGLAFEPVPQPDAVAGTCGLLRCRCAVYPVLDGIPVLTRDRLAHRSIADDRAVAGGPQPSDLAALVAAGRALDGLVDLLTFPVCPWPLNRIGAFRRLSLRGPHQALGLVYRRRLVRRMLTRRDALTAEDWLSAFYWHAPIPFDPFNYFFFRFGQPRHLATLGLLAILPPSERPLLDLACGYGHFLHTVSAGGQAAVGLDQNFHQLWVARHYVAPEAAFVCADAGSPLPFRSGTLSAALCADAFYYLRDKATCLDELDRCTDGGPLLLASVNNRLVGEADGGALTPEGYAALLDGRPHRALTEAAILERYLDGRAPDLRSSSPDGALRGSRWLYYVAARDDALFDDHGPFAAWPHAAGTVRLNPVYEAAGDGFVFRFLSPWYALENAGMRTYLPPTASLREGRAELLAHAALIGLPERYARPSGRRWPFAANRFLLTLSQRLRPS